MYIGVNVAMQVYKGCIKGILNKYNIMVHRTIAFSSATVLEGWYGSWILILVGLDRHLIPPGLPYA